MALELQLPCPFCGVASQGGPWFDKSVSETSSAGSSSDITLLAGKVLKRSLPVVQPPAQGPVIKRLMLPQGELAQFYDSDEPIRYVAFIELCAGSVRGNHYHKIKEEWIYIILGQVLLQILDVESKASDSVELCAGDLVVIRTGVTHALRIGTPGQAIEFSPNRFDPDDIYRFSLG
jgi:mannose-6-phosphate isomerase-like protein (cupin superfamily)